MHGETVKKKLVLYKIEKFKLFIKNNVGTVDIK